MNKFYDPTGKTPDFNPNASDTFKPYSFIKTAANGISARTQAQLNQLVRDMNPQQPKPQVNQQTMQSTQGMIQLPNGSFVTPEQYQQLLQKLQQRR